MQRPHLVESEDADDSSYVPAQNIEAEQSLLGGLISGLDQSAIARITDLITPEAFYVQGHQTIYKTLLDLHQQGKSVDLMSCVDSLQASGRLKAIGGGKYLRSLIDFSLNCINLDGYADLITAKYKHRRVNEILRNALSDVSDSTQPLEAILARAGDAFTELAGIEKAPITTLSTALLEAYSSLQERFEADRPTGNLTGLTDLDGYTGGIQPKTLGFLAARPSMGKTSLALEIAKGCAEKGASVLFFSIEMPAEDLCDRYLSSTAQVEGTRLKSAKHLHQKEWDRLGQSVGELGVLPIWFDDSSTISADQIVARTKLWIAKEGIDPKRAIVFIDHLNLLSQANECDTGHVATGKNTKRLKALAKSSGCAVVCLLQLNRSVESRQDKRPTLSDGRESGSIEEDADYFFGIYRDDYYNAESEHRNITELLVLKNRNGPRGTIKLLFEPEFTKFTTLGGH
jgi:replicative DNA helicase